MSSYSTQGLNSLIYDKAKSNSEASYKKLFGLLFNSLFRFSFCILRSKEWAEEVAGGIMFRLRHHKYASLQVKNIQVYGQVITRNWSLNVLKKKGRSKIISEKDIDVEINLSALSLEQILINTQYPKGI